jgi:hypothetical protein
VLDVVVELLSGRRFEYKFGEHMQVGFLMELVAEKMDVEWQRIQLHWNGRMLDWQKQWMLRRPQLSAARAIASHY